MPKRLLFVEDSSLVLKVMKRLVKEEGLYEADFAETYAQAEAFIGDDPSKYFATVVDLNLPDAPKGEIVDLVLGHKMPTLVLTATYSDKKRDELFKKGIVDYVVKENRYSYSYAIKLINRLSRNHEMKILVVDDALVARKATSKLLSKYQFQVFQADGAKSAIRTLIDNPDIKLVITDYHMPEIDGFELVKMLRGKYDKQSLTIIGISGEGKASVSAKFIKHGANDFLRKPFNEEEFYCRIMHSVEALEYIDTIQESSRRDSLTNLYNREHFSSVVNQKIKQCQENQQDYATIILEVDRLAQFNNVQSDYGERLLKKCANELRDYFSEFITARLNSSQLVCFVWGMAFSDCEMQMNDLREVLKSEPIIINDEEIYATASIGFTHSTNATLVDMLTECSELIARALNAGNDIAIGSALE
jgi:diguanylate cyclase (GGDEF)-like protein